MKIDLNYRKMVKEDALKVEQVEKECFSLPWSRETFWQEASKSEAYYLVAETKDEKKDIVAYIGIWFIFNEGHITNVAVKEKYRKCGIGKNLIEKIIEIAKKHGIESITLEVRPSNEPALKLYHKFGFKSVGKRPHYYLDNGEDAEIMWLIFKDKNNQ